MAALGIGLYARPGIGGSYYTTFFPAVLVLGLGMAVTVAPLTTTVMGAVETQHAGVASGINNAVSRVAGLLAVAVFGVFLARTFDGRVAVSFDGLRLTSSVRSGIDRELPKMAGADVAAIPMIDPAQRSAIRNAVASAFVSAFRLVMVGAAALAFAAAIAGVFLR
jgi:hypothetical protein